MQEEISEEGEGEGEMEIDINDPEDAYYRN